MPEWCQTAVRTTDENCVVWADMSSCIWCRHVMLERCRCSLRKVNLCGSRVSVCQDADRWQDMSVQSSFQIHVELYVLLLSSSICLRVVSLQLCNWLTCNADRNVYHSVSAKCSKCHLSVCNCTIHRCFYSTSLNYNSGTVRRELVQRTLFVCSSANYLYQSS